MADVKQKVTFKCEVATTKSLRRQLSMGCRVLHYHGMGRPSYLVLEKDRPVGEAHVVDVFTLKELLAPALSGGGRLQLVIVNATDAEGTARAFLGAGVSHVVVVSSSAGASERVSVLFLEFFYLSLLMGRTIKQAFDVAIAAAKADSGHNHVPESQFLLLPRAADHDKAVFGDAQSGDYTDETPVEVAHNHDKPPDPFVGRQHEMQQVVKAMTSMAHVRCTAITGLQGIGKTALASAVCQYSADRHVFEGFYLVPLHDHGAADKGMLCKALGSALGYGDASNEREVVFLLQDKHPSTRVVLLLEDADALLPAHSPLISVLTYLLARCNGLHVLLTTSTSPPSSPSSSPSKASSLAPPPLCGVSSALARLQGADAEVVELGPLSDTSAARLLVSLAPPGSRLATVAASEVGTAEEPFSALAESCVVKGLRGHPRAITTLAPLLEGRDLDELMQDVDEVYTHALKGVCRGKRSTTVFEQRNHRENNGGMTRREEVGVLVLPSSGRLRAELSEQTLKPESTEAEKILQDPSCRRIWQEVVRQGGMQTAGMHNGVPWYRVTDALQQDLHTSLLTLLNNKQLTQLAAPLPAAAQNFPPAKNVQKGNLRKTATSKAVAAVAAAVLRRDRGPVQTRSTCSAAVATVNLDRVSTCASVRRIGVDAVRGLDIGDVRFIKEKLGVTDADAQVSISSFAAFSNGWSPALTTLKRLWREWLCEYPRLLHGFLSRTEVEARLCGKSAGTFLLRLSCSHMGLLSLSFVGRAESAAAGDVNVTQIRHYLVQVEEGGACVLFVEPKRQRYDSLRDLVMAFNGLVELDSGAGKTKAFEQVDQLQ